MNKLILETRIAQERYRTIQKLPIDAKQKNFEEFFKELKVVQKIKPLIDKEKRQLQIRSKKFEKLRKMIESKNKKDGQHGATRRNSRAEAAEPHGMSQTLKGKTSFRCVTNLADADARQSKTFLMHQEQS